MAGADRKQAAPLRRTLEAIARTPYRFGFFQAMRLMECLHDDLPRLGMSRQPKDDPVRLAQEPATTFETASLTRFDIGDDAAPHRLSVRFLGLLGPNGPLPLHITEYVQDRLIHHRDRTLAWFLDIFHHRMLSFFYRAWANNEPTVSFDRPETDRFSDYVGSLAGLGMDKLRNRDEMPDGAKLHYIGRLACQTKCAEGLESMLSDYFNLPARIKSFIGEWLPLPENDVCRLGVRQETAQLNLSIILGKRFWGCQHKFRIIMGPLNFRDFTSLLPIGARIRRLRDMVRNYIGDELAWDLRLILKKEDVPVAHLNKGCRLGWTTWLANRTEDADADNLLLNPADFRHCFEEADASCVA